MSNVRAATAVIGAACLSLVAIGVAAAGGTSPLARANALLAQMTFDEKVSMASSGDAGVPRLGIPGLVFDDGPNGVGHGAPDVTAFPNAQVVAASWDRLLAERFGEALGAETAGKGFNYLAAPTINILRTPKWGRAAETFGEDPYLSGQIAAAEIRGIQSEHVISQVKHFAANNQEIARFGNPLGKPTFSQAVNVVVSERALREIYFPAFKAAVQEGEAASIMCSYPRINGTYACQNPSILGPPKTDWGFLGFVGPDAFLAVRNTVNAINAGTDNFQLGGLGIPPDQALQQVSSDRLDDMVRRILTGMFSVGIFDNPNTGSPGAVVTSADHRALSTEVAANGTVLLKNDGGVLPLDGVTSIAVIGHDAGPGTQTMEGGSAAVVGGPLVTPLDGITARAGAGVTVTFAEGTLGVVPLPVVPSSALTPSSGTGPGLFGQYYASMDLTGSPLAAFVSSTIDFGTALSVGGAHSARWTGTLTPPVTGTYRFSLTHAGIAQLFVDGVLVANGNNEGLDLSPDLPGAPLQTFHGLATLTAGTPVPIAIEYSIGSSTAGSPLHLGWQPPDPTLVANAVAAASAADVAVVFANDVTGEGMDRSNLVLPPDQDELIAAVAAANPRTIVVLHTAGPVLMPWLSQVAAVLEAWYPGQQSGDAIAAVLFGDVDPSGRLPMTFPASEAQGPATQPADYPGVNNVVTYTEEIFVGYRYFDQFAQAPLFPFGHGLSYTSFSLDHLRVTRRRGGTYRVAVRVTNTGTRTGTAVPELYVGFPSAAGEPPNQLKGFGKVTLRPRRRARVKMVLDPSSFGTWSTADHAFDVVPGAYRLRVGTSSRDLPLETSVALAGGLIGP